MINLRDSININYATTRMSPRTPALFIPLHHISILRILTCGLKSAFLSPTGLFCSVLLCNGWDWSENVAHLRFKVLKHRHLNNEKDQLTFYIVTTLRRRLTNNLACNCRDQHVFIWWSLDTLCTNQYYRRLYRQIIWCTWCNIITFKQVRGAA